MYSSGFAFTSLVLQWSATQFEKPTIKKNKLQPTTNTKSLTYSFVLVNKQTQCWTSFMIDFWLFLFFFIIFSFYSESGRISLGKWKRIKSHIPWQHIWSARRILTISLWHLISFLSHFYRRACVPIRDCVCVWVCFVCCLCSTVFKAIYLSKSFATVNFKKKGKTVNTPNSHFEKNSMDRKKHTLKKKQPKWKWRKVAKKMATMSFYI